MTELNLNHYQYDTTHSPFQIVFQRKRQRGYEQGAYWEYKKHYLEEREYTKAVENISNLLNERFKGSYTTTLHQPIDGKRRVTTIELDAIHDDIPEQVLKYFRFLSAPKAGRLFYLKLARDKWLKALEGYLSEVHYHHVYLFYSKDDDTILVYLSNYPETFDLRGGGFKHVYPSHVNVYETLTHRNGVQQSSLTLFEMMSIKNLQRMDGILKERIKQYESFTTQAKPIVEDTVDEIEGKVLEVDTLYRFLDDDSHGLRLVQHTAINVKDPYVLVRDVKSKLQYFYYGSVVSDYIKKHNDYFIQNGINVRTIQQQDINLNHHYGYGIVVGETQQDEIINVLSIITRGVVYHQYPSLLRDTTSIIQPKQ